MNAFEARVNVTWAGFNGDLPDPVLFDAPDVAVRDWVAEAIRTGSIPGIPADGRVDLRDFVVDRFPAGGEVPFLRIFVRPKTPFG